VMHDCCGSEDGQKEREEIVEAARTLQVGQAAQIWWRCVLQFETWPFKFLELVHPREAQGDLETKRRIRDLLRDTPTCCLDASFTQKVLGLEKGRGSMGWRKVGVGNNSASRK
jgi:hypothetical protein